MNLSVLKMKNSSMKVLTTCQSALARKKYYFFYFSIYFVEINWQFYLKQPDNLLNL